MKYLKTFEDRLDRNRNLKFLSREDEIKLKVFVLEYIEDLKILNKIKKLKLSDYEDYNFDYDEIFDYLINCRGTYNPDSFKKTGGNLYYHVDKFNLDNKFNWSNFELRNSLFNILEKIYKEYDKNGLKNALDDRLIKLFEKNPEYYRDEVDREELSLNVQKACEYMIAGDKYNI